jgi:hypothetical protein
MNQILVIVFLGKEIDIYTNYRMKYRSILLAFLPACTALNCYVCASGMMGCNDPFNAAAYNVTTLSHVPNTFCVVIG